MQTPGKFAEGELGMEYHGTMLKSTPVNLTLDQVVLYLTGRVPFTVVLEPGDATRYVLTFLPLRGSGMEADHWHPDHLRDSWMVCRSMEHERFAGVLLNLHHAVIPANVEVLARGNEHTVSVFVSWLNQVFNLARFEGVE